MISPMIAGTIGFVILFALFFIGLPVGISLLLVGFAGIVYLSYASAGFVAVALVPFNTISTYDFSCLPLFIFMGEIVFATGFGKDLYNLAEKWLGFLPGGLAMASIGACAIFAAISSSSIATAITIGLVAFPAMKSYNYDPRLAIGSVTAGGTLGILIPPSSMLIIYGILTDTSIGRLFIAGVFPGVTQAILYFLAIYILCRLNPKLGGRLPSSSFKEKVAAFGKCGEVVCLVFIILGGLMIGWFTPIEAGAAGAFGAVVLSLLRRRMNWQSFQKALVNTAQTSGMIFFILIGAFIFSQFVEMSELPLGLSGVVTELALPPLGVMISIILIYIILGTFMEEGTMMMVTIPLFFPLVTSLGFDPVWFGIIATRMLEMAMISPPVGMNLFVVKGISGESMGTVYRGVLPFFYTDCFHVIFLLLFPALSLFLPNLVYGAR